MGMKRSAWLWIAAALLAPAPPAFAAEEGAPPPPQASPKDKPGEEHRAKREPRHPEARRAPGQARRAESLSREFSVPVEEVFRLRDSGLGWGEVRHALSLSERSGKPLGEIMTMRQGGMGWGRIARELGLKLRGKERMPRREPPAAGDEERVDPAKPPEDRMEPPRPPEERTRAPGPRPVQRSSETPAAERRPERAERRGGWERAAPRVPRTQGPAGRGSSRGRGPR